MTIQAHLQHHRLLLGWERPDPDPTLHELCLEKMRRFLFLKKNVDHTKIHSTRYSLISMLNPTQ